MDLSANRPVAILLHDGIHHRDRGKTGLTFLRYSEATVVAAIDRHSAGESLAALTGIERPVPIVASVAEALSYQPEVLIIGIAPSGGVLPWEWQADIRQALQEGLSIVSGLHTPLASLVDETMTLKPGQEIWELRREPEGLKVGSGLARTLTCQRILTVGTDMSIGKMSASIELHRAAKAGAIASRLLATGQGGMMLTGDGIPLDAVRVDFAAGAVEQMAMGLGQGCEVLWIEGQGSLLHPGSTATLPLIRGSQPTGLVLVHRAQQLKIRHLDHVPIPPLPEVVALYETVASAAGAFGIVKVKAIALNTFHLDDEAARLEIDRVGQETGLPCTDVVRFGAKSLLDAVLG